MARTKSTPNSHLPTNTMRDNTNSAGSTSAMKNDTTPQKPSGTQLAAPPTPSPEAEATIPPAPVDDPVDLAADLLQLQAGVTTDDDTAVVTQPAASQNIPSPDTTPSPDSVASTVPIVNPVPQQLPRRFNIRDVIQEQNHFSDLYSDVSDMSDIELSDDEEEPDSDAEKEGEHGKKRRRAAAPATHPPVFRPIAKGAAFVCQNEHFGNGKPCKFQRECQREDCDHGPDKKCPTADLNNYSVGTMLGPVDDWDAPNDVPIDEKTGEPKYKSVQKTARTCIKDYFGRNKNQSQHIDFDPMRVCRKCYQHLSYQDAKGAAKKWPRRQCKMLLHGLDIIEGQQVRESGGQPGLWDIKLKTTQERELNKYLTAKRTKTPYTVPKSESKPKAKKGKKARLSEGASELDDATDTEKKREHNKKEYYAPMKYLRFIQDNFCGKNKTVDDCRNLDKYMLQLIKKGKIEQNVLYEHTPVWEGSKLYKGNQPKTPKSRGKGATPAKSVAKTPAAPKTPAPKGKGKSPSTRSPIVKQETPSTQVNGTPAAYTPYPGPTNIRQGHPAQPTTRLAPVPAAQPTPVPETQPEPVPTSEEEKYDSDATDLYNEEQLAILNAPAVDSLVAARLTRKRPAGEPASTPPPAKKTRRDSV